MTCKKCRATINLTMAGMPIDECWGCMTANDKDIILEHNLNAKKNERNEPGNKPNDTRSSRCVK